MKNNANVKSKRILVIMFCFALSLLSIIPAFVFRTNAEESTEGERFANVGTEDVLYILKPLESFPRSFEAVVDIDDDVSSASPIITSLYGDEVSGISFEITKDGKPALHYSYQNKDSAYYSYNIEKIERETYVTFDYDVRNKGAVHLIATNEIVDGKSVYKLYVNGVLASTVSSEPYVYDFDILLLQNSRRLFSIGSDLAGEAFDGVIKSVAVYSDALSADEALAIYTAGTDVEHNDIMAYFDFTSSENTERRIKDLTGNGHDAGYMFEDNDEPFTDYAYSVAVVGDTQNLVYKDATTGTNYTSYIYDWIVANKESKNIQFVMGLGDITDEDIASEWDVASRELDKLEAAGLPYSLVQGNHDTVKKLNEYFENKDNFTKGDIGYFSGTSLGNYYMTFTAKDKSGSLTDHKYMIVALEFSPTDAVMDWANEVIAEHSEYSVILTMHSYLNNDLDYININSSPPSRRPTESSGTNNGDQIWMKVASQHENVIMVLGGHSSNPLIAMKEAVGVNGNTVYEFLIDPQYMDKSTYEFETSLVAMFYFSADGKTVYTEYVSAYKTIEAQKLDPGASDVIYDPYRSCHQFTLYEDQAISAVECEYGVIPAEYSNATIYPFVVFTADKRFVGGYYDFGDVMNAMVKNDPTLDYNVLMRRHAEQSYASSVGELCGNINIDLGGFILSKCKSGYLLNVSRIDNSSVSGDVDKRASFRIFNGSINKLAGEALVCIDYGSSSAGLSKTYSVSVDFENVVFVNKHSDGTKWIFDTKESGYSKTAADVKVLVDATFTDCTFDYERSTVVIPALTLSKGSSDKTVYNVTVVGGEIVSKVGISYSDFVVANGDANGRADNVIFTKNADGEYIIQRVTKGATAPGTTDAWTTDDGNGYVPSESGIENGYTVYKLDGFLEVKYGKIPLGAKNYAIVVFHNGTFIGGYDEFGGNSGAIAAAKAATDGDKSGEKGTTVHILFLADAPASSNFDNLGQSCGNIIVDLDGHTLTQKYTGKSLFITMAKKGYGMDSYFLNVINGNIVITNAGVLTFGAYGTYAEATEEYKLCEAKFENVRFSYVSGSSATSFLGRYDGKLDTYKKTMYDVEFVDCVFDFTNASSLKTVMNANDKDTTLIEDIVKVNIYGGEIVTSNTALVFEDVHATNGSSVSWEASSEGKYTYVTVNGTTDMPIAEVNGGALSFVKVSETDNSVTYTFESVGLKTKYGVVPNESLDATFAIFSDGEFIGASNVFSGTSTTERDSTSVIAIAKKQLSKNTQNSDGSLAANSKSVEVVLLKDYVAPSSEYNDNLAQIKGQLTVDLDGHTFTNTTHMFRVHAKSYTYESTIIVKNGSVVIGKDALMRFGNYGTVNGKKFNMNYENITFSLKSGSTLTKMMVEYKKQRNVTALFDINFDDCVFDITNATNKITLFEANDPVTDYPTPHTFNYTVKGCDIKAKTADSFTVWGTFNTSSTYSYALSSRTNLYLTVTLPKGAESPKGTVTIDGKLLGYANYSEADGYVTYALGEMTEYGAIPPKYASVSSYPFVVFDENGNCIGASKTFYGKTSEDSIVNLAKIYLKGNKYDGTSYTGTVRSAYILMRADYSIDKNGEYYDNLAQIQGTVVIDLGGFTFESRENSYMVRAQSKSWSGAGNKQVFPSEIVMKNGTILLYNSPMIRFNGALSGDGKQFTFGYENIKFKIAGVTASFATAYTGLTEGSESARFFGELYFNNCEIDITEATNEKLVLFNLGDAYTSTNVKLSGCTIISNTGNFNLWGKKSESSTGVLTSVWQGENATVLILPESATAPSDDMYSFVKTSENDGYINYCLKLTVTVDFKIKTSVTLYSNFVYNIYIPEANFNKAMIDGVDATATLVEIDGVNYYHVVVNIPAAESLDDIKLTVTLNSGNTTVDANWTLSVLKYAKSVTAGNYNDTTKDLMKDMLVYASAAHTYFENALDADKAAEVTALLTGHSAEMPEGEAKKPTDTTYFTTVGVNIGAVPSFRFYLAAGYTKDNFSFKVGNRTVEATVGNDKYGDYLEVTMYAYMMLDDVTFTVKGTDVTGTYNLYSYYEYAKTLNNDNLVAIVEGLIKYSASAKAYRALVAGK